MSSGKECSAAALAARAINVLMAAVDATCGRNRSTNAINEAAALPPPPPPPPPDAKVESPRTPTNETEPQETVEQKLVAPQQHPPPRMGNTSRDRMKLEMQYLRDTKEELQRQLDELKRRSPRIDAIKSNDPSVMQLATAWESLARGQCEQRYRAEVENVKLRTLLDEQIKIAQTLERILSKRKHTEFVDCKCRKRTREASAHQIKSPLHSPDAIADMNAVLPSLYMQVETVVNKPCFQHRTAPFRDVSTHHAEPSGVYVEATELRLLPFPLQDTADAVWHNFIVYPDSKSNVDDKEEMLGQLEPDMDVSIQLQRFTGDLGVKFVARRFQEPNRIVFVWVAMIDPSEIPIDDVIIRHTGWVCLRPSRVVPEEEGITEYLHAQLCVPEFYHRDMDRKRRIGTLTNFIVDSLESQMDQSKQAIDNRLLERTLAKSRIAKSM